MISKNGEDVILLEQPSLSRQTSATDSCAEFPDDDTRSRTWSAPDSDDIAIESSSLHTLNYSSEDTSKKTYGADESLPSYGSSQQNTTHGIPENKIKNQNGCKMTTLVQNMLILGKSETKTDDTSMKLVREHPFNLKGGGVWFFFSESNFFFASQRSRQLQKICVHQICRQNFFPQKNP